MKKDDVALTEEQMRKRAAEGYFIRDLEKDRVYCPTGEILRKNLPGKTAISVMQIKWHVNNVHIKADAPAPYGKKSTSRKRYGKCAILTG